MLKVQTVFIKNCNQHNARFKTSHITYFSPYSFLSLETIAPDNRLGLETGSLDSGITIYRTVSGRERDVSRTDLNQNTEAVGCNG